MNAKNDLAISVPIFSPSTSSSAFVLHQSKSKRTQPPRGNSGINCFGGLLVGCQHGGLGWVSLFRVFSPSTTKWIDTAPVQKSTSLWKIGKDVPVVSNEATGLIPPTHTLFCVATYC